MTSLLKVDLIIHRTADQYHHYSSAYPFFKIFFPQNFFTASEKNQIITGFFYMNQKLSLKLEYNWSIMPHCNVFIMMENANKTNSCVNVSNGTR